MFVVFSLRWGFGPLSYCVLPIFIWFCAMSVTHFSLIRRLRRLLAVCTGRRTSRLDSGQRRRLRLYYGVICLVAFSGFALLLVTSRPWRLKAMIRSGAVLSSLGIIYSLLSYWGGRKAVQAKVDEKGAQSVCP